MAKEERAGAARVQRILTDRPRYVNLMVLLRILCEITATVVLVGGLIDVLSLGWALTVTAVIMVLVSYVVIGVGPRTLGRQHAYSIAMAASLPLLWIGVLLGPISRVLILVGNALTPGKASATARSRRKSSCVNSWTWRRNVASWPTKNAE